MKDRYDFAGLQEYAATHPLVRKADSTLTGSNFRFLPNGISVALSLNR